MDVETNDDFRPDPRHRASSPSLEEMLRRACDAHLGDHDTVPRDNGWPLPHLLLPSDGQPGSAIRAGVLFGAGILVGVLLAIFVVQTTALVSRIATWTDSPSTSVTVVAPVPATPTAPLLPTATATPVPTPTDVPTATPTPYLAPPPPSEVVLLAQAFYNTQGPFAGSYVLRDVTALQIVSQGDDSLAACIAYDAAAVSAPDTVVATNTRLFTLAVVRDGTWQVMQMGASGSCNLS